MKPMNTPPKILIAEDEKPMAHALEIKFKAVGFDVKTVFDGQEVLKALETEKFDLLILDLIMPRLDGFGVLAVLKEKGSTIPIIVASNLGQTDDISRSLALGAEDYFVKSNVSIAEIIDKIKVRLDIK